MKGRQAWRLAAMISAVCWCGFADAQEPGRPRMQGVLVDDLRGKAKVNEDAVEEMLAEELVMQLVAADAAPPNTELERCREQIDVELRFIARALTLTPDERQLLNEVGEELSQVIAGALAKRAAKVQPRIVGPRQAPRVERRFVPPGALRQGFFSDEEVRQAVDVAIGGHLSSEILAKLEAEREHLGDRIQVAGVLALLSAMDEAILLDARQRGVFRDFLEPNWQPVWRHFASNRVLGSAATPLQAAKARSLGSLISDLDQHLARTLRQAQLDIWRELDVRRQVQQAFKQQEVKRVVVRRMREADGKVVEQIVRVVPPPARQAAPALVGFIAPEQLRPSIANAPAVESPKELTLLLNLLVEDAAATGRLSDEQRETLLLAGKLDLGRYCAEKEARLRDLFQEAPDALRNRQLALQADSAATENPFAAAGSRFRKALASRLDEEQLARLAEADRKRRELRREAAVQSIVRQLDEAAKLTTAQWDALADAIRRRQQLSAAAVADDFQSESDACASWLAKADLQPIVDADQWPAVEQKLIELKRVAGAAAAPGAP